MIYFNITNLQLKNNLNSSQRSKVTVFYRTTHTETITIKSEVEIKSDSTTSSLQTQSHSNENMTSTDSTHQIISNTSQLEAFYERINKLEETSIDSKKQEKQEKNFENNEQSSFSGSLIIYINSSTSSSFLSKFILFSFMDEDSLVIFTGSDEKEAKIETKIQQIKIGMVTTTEAIDKTLQKNGILLTRSQRATERAWLLIKRATNFLRSIENPGRVAFYIAGGITLAFTIYNIFRYMEIPMNILSRTATGAVSSIAPVISPVININYPSVSSIPTLSGSTDTLMMVIGKVFENPGTMILLATFLVVKAFRK
jgi:hypothetical protein